MSRAVLILTDRATRERAASWCLNAPPGCRVEFKEAKRSPEQNALMWALLTEVARQVEWHGLKLSADDWKLIFLASLHQEMRLVPNIDGTGFVNLGRSSSDLSKGEMTDLIELILMFGAQRGVEFADHGQGTGSAEQAPPTAA
jgi:hypothetical protein